MQRYNMNRQRTALLQRCNINRQRTALLAQCFADPSAPPRYCRRHRVVPAGGTSGAGRRHRWYWPAVLGGTGRYWAVLCGTGRYCAVLGGTVRYWAVLCGTGRYSAVLCGTVRYCSVLGGTVRHCSVLAGTVGGTVGGTGRYCTGLFSAIAVPCSAVHYSTLGLAYECARCFAALGRLRTRRTRSRCVATRRLPSVPLSGNHFRREGGTIQAGTGPPDPRTPPVVVGHTAAECVHEPPRKRPS
jgi:hypothetical protein